MIYYEDWENAEIGANANHVKILRIFKDKV